MWWRLLEVGEKRERCDEIFSMSPGDGWFQCSNCAVGSTVRKEHAPCRRRVPSSGAEISAGKARPDDLVKLGDHVGINCGTWFGCTGRVTFVFNTSERCCVELDNVYAGGNRMVITEPLDNVTVLVGC